MNIIFAGTPEFAAVSLRQLLAQGHHIVAVYTQPDRPAGRGKKLLASEVKQVALEHHIPVYQPINFKNSADLEALNSLQADLMIVAAYGIILPEEVLIAPRLGCINIHASLLPRWRGAAPIQRAIEAGDTETGITIMQMDAGLDTGAMLLTKSTEINPDDTGGSLHDRLAGLGGDAILEFLASISETSGASTLTATPQNDADACYARKLSKQEASIDWTLNATEIARRVRAFNPWPVAYAKHAGDNIRILEAKAETSDSTQPAGTILEKAKSGIRISCGQGQLRITRLQLPGGKAMSTEDFVNGGRPLLQAGICLGSD